MSTVESTRILRSCEGCGSVFYADAHEVRRGFGKFCNKSCWRNWQKTRSVKDCFLSYICMPTSNGCLLWTGSIGSNGYGRFWFGGKRGKDIYAHRAAWEVANGPIPNSLFVLHNCPGGDNPICVNPLHLFLGTQADNVADMIAKGRDSNQKGEMNNASRLKNETIIEIRKRYGNGQSFGQISRDLHVARYWVSQIARREAWTHI